MVKRRKRMSRVVWRASHAVWPAAAEAIHRAAGRALTALTPGTPSPRPAVTRVIFACMHNAGRSQMAAAFFNQIAHPSRARAISAGTRAARSVDPGVREAMREAGVDLGQGLSRRLNAPLAMASGHLVTMGCGDDLPFFAGVRVQDWAIEDPRDQTLDRVREIRDEIRRRVTEMVDGNGWAQR